MHLNCIAFLIRSESQSASVLNIYNQPKVRINKPVLNLKKMLVRLMFVMLFYPLLHPLHRLEI